MVFKLLLAMICGTNLPEAYAMFLHAYILNYILKSQIQTHYST